MRLSDIEINEQCYCQECYEHLIDLFRRHGMSLKENGSIKNLIASELLTCDACNTTISTDVEYYKLSVSEDSLEELADHISDNIGGCENCEGNERAHYVHVFNDDPHDPSSRISLDDINTSASIEEYLYGQGVPEEQMERFAQLIKCPCGYGREEEHHSHNPGGGVFSLYDDIYTRQDIADFWGFDVQEFLSFTQQYGITLSLDDMINFRAHLLEFPMLAFRHETGITIYDALKAHFEASQYVTVDIGTTLYRGRTRNKDEAGPYPKEKMWAPSPGKPQHGRFNTIGVSVLYVTDSETALPYEIHPTPDQYVDVIEFKAGRAFRVFDIGDFDPGFRGFFNEPNEESNPLKKAYILPNYIGTCCSHIGYDGVMYEGVHKNHPTFTNYALFNIDKMDIPIQKAVRTVNSYITYKLGPVVPVHDVTIDF